MLFNWLYARHTGGRVVLRFEDTDRARSTEEAIAQARGRARAGSGSTGTTARTARPSGSTSTRPRRPQLVDERRRLPLLLHGRGAGRPSAERRQAAGLPLIYSGRCRTLAAEQRADLGAAARHPPGDAGRRHDARSTTSSAAPSSGTTRSSATTSSSAPTARPTYLFANPFDDIEHGHHPRHPRRGPAAVDAAPARGLRRARAPSRPRTPTCRWCSAPTRRSSPSATAPSRSRSSATAAYLAEALVNYLALVGWSFDDHTTMMTVAELVERFTLERVNRAPACSTPEKLEWLNGEHLRALPPAEFAAALQRYLEAPGSPLATQPERVAEVAPHRAGEAARARRVRGVRRVPVRPREIDPGGLGRVEARCGRAPLAGRGPRARSPALAAWDAEAIEAALPPRARRRA